MPQCRHTKHILLIDDHELFRAGLRLILAPKVTATILEIEKISDVSLVRPTIDVVILDICLPGLNGIDGMTIIQKRWPDARIMLLSALSHHQEINWALEAGACCFLNKDSTPPVICQAVQSLLDNHGSKRSHSSQAKSGLLGQQRKTLLSPRLLEVLALIAEGQSNKLIAHKLSLSENTVRNHVAHLMEHFDVHNRTQIILAAQQAGYITILGSPPRSKDSLL